MGTAESQAVQASSYSKSMLIHGTQRLSYQTHSQNNPLSRGEISPFLKAEPPGQVTSPDLTRGIKSQHDFGWGQSNHRGAGSLQEDQGRAGVKALPGTRPQSPCPLGPQGRGSGQLGAGHTEQGCPHPRDHTPGQLLTNQLALTTRIQTMLFGFTLSVLFERQAETPT